MEEKKGFFDGNPKMLFVFGLVTGVAVVSIFGGGISWPSLSANNEDEVVRTFEDEQNVDDVEAAPAPAPVLAAITEEDHILGDIQSAKVVLVEYSDFECPFCDRHHPNVKQVMKDYGDDIAWVYRHFPLSFHPEAVPSAQASECAAEQEKFWEFADAMYKRQDELGEDLYYELAEEFGLDTERFEECYTSDKYAQDVQNDLQSGMDAGVQGTPATFVNGVLVSGAVPYETLADAIEQALEN